MKSVLGLINLYEKEELVREITHHRPLAAVPFAGRYRLIDFILSNMVNSGIRNVGILACNNFRSLMDHLRSGKEWDLARKKDGLFILPSNQTQLSGQFPVGDIDQMYAHLDYIKRSNEKYVLVSGSAMVCNIGFGPVMDYHQKSGADITIVYKPNCRLTEADYRNCAFIQVEPDGRVSDVALHYNSGAANMSMRMYLMRKELLLEIVERCILRGEHDFIKDGLIQNITRFKMYGYPFDGYLAKINSVNSYFQHSMDLLRQDVWQNLFGRSGSIYTKIKDEAPTKYRPEARVRNSLVANGCIIEGTVENSILFRGVKIHKGAVVQNSIVMQKVEIYEDAALDYAICDKDARIGCGRTLKGEKNYPIIIKKGTVI